jgi:hypothetical protein
MMFRHHERRRDTTASCSRQITREVNVVRSGVGVVLCAESTTQDSLERI